LGNPVFTFDARGHKVTVEYDVLGRPLLTRVLGNGLDNITERLIYGESHSQPKLHNLCGKLYKHYDQAGLVTFASYSFKGEPLQSEQRIRTEYKLESNWANGSNWEALLEAENFITEIKYDALGRIKEQNSADGSITRSEYHFSGKLNKVLVKPKSETAFTEFVSGITYNPKGQRERILYGNFTRTDYTYERETFRLTGLKTIRTSDNTELQDITYTYDPVGNITSIIDDSHKRVFHAGQIVDAENKFVYDALYRLTEAVGREHLALNNPLDANNGEFKHSVFVNLNDGQNLAKYTQFYSYDKAGNITKIQHQNTANSARNFTRNMVVAPNSNRAIPDSMGADTTNFFDANGNITALEHLAGINWNYRNNICKATIISRPSSTDDAEYYVYNSAGQRVRKIKETLVSGNIAIEEKIYLGGVEIKRVRTGTTVSLERWDLHVMDDKSRIAIVNHWTVDANLNEIDSPSDLGVNKIHYQYGNHLGSASLELNSNGQIISYEEYFPYGGTSLITGQNQKEVKIKEYRYTGKERDDATGLYYHGARYYACWLGRWLSCDPAGLVDGENLYVYCKSNPIIFNDPNGRQSTCDLFTETFTRKGKTYNSVEEVLRPPVSRGSQPTTRNNTTLPSTSQVDEAAKRSLGGAGLEAAKHSPKGYTLEVPNSFDNEKMAAYNKRIPEGKIGRNAGPDNSTSLRRNTPEQRSAQKQFELSNLERKKEFKNPSKDHIVELQHDLTGKSGNKPNDYRWQEHPKNITEGSQSWQLNKNNPQGVPAGGVARTQDIGKWYNQPATRTAGRVGGGALSVYGVYTTTMDLADAAGESIATGSVKPIAAESIRQTGGWVAGAKGFKVGFGVGAACGIKTGPGLVVTGLIGGTIIGTAGYMGADWAAGFIHKK